MSDLTANTTPIPLAASAPPTVRQLAALLRPHRVREMFALAATALVAAYAAGYETSALVARPGITQLQAERHGLQARVAALEAIAAKVEFLALYLRHRIARDAYFALASDANRDAMRASAAAASAYVDVLLKPGADGAAPANLLDGGAPGFGSTLKFANDGSLWPLPAELGR
jgi:hypothetical protein